MSAGCLPHRAHRRLGLALRQMPASGRKQTLARQFGESTVEGHRYEPHKR